MKRSIFGLSIILLFFFISASFQLNAQKNKYESQVVANIGSEKITYSDLEKAFQKNMSRKNARLADVPADSVIDFLHLYVNYRLKVQDALNRGFDKDSSVVADIEQNRRILAESFLFEKEVTDRHIDKMLEMRKRELQMSIILFTFEQGAFIDTTAAYKRALVAQERLKKGELFSKVAFDMSDDKESSKRGGLIPPYITAGRVQRPIESVIYKMKEGEVYPELVKTRYGYFIIKLEKNIPRKLVLASHILLTESVERDSLATLKTADSLIALLKAGADFARLAEENSDDPTTAIRGGMLGDYYSRSTGFENSGKTVFSQFEDAMFALKDGDFSDKIETELGIHIIKRDSTKEISLEKENEDLRKLYKRIYFQEDKQQYIDEQRNKLGFKIYDDALKALLSSVDTNATNLDSAWASRVEKAKLEKPLYKFINTETKLGEFVQELSSRADLRGTPINEEGIRKAIGKITEPKTIDEATKDLEKRYAEFTALMNEFRDGILLFRVAAMEVWDNLKFDSALAQIYYDSTKTKYRTDHEYDITEIFVLSDSLASSLFNRARNGEDFDMLAEQFTQRAGYREKKGYWGVVSAKNNNIAKVLDQKNVREPMIHAPFNVDNGISIVKINKYLAPRIKTFEEAIPEFAPAFQDLMQTNLTNAWIDRIKKKITVKTNVQALEKALVEAKKQR